MWVVKLINSFPSWFVPVTCLRKRSGDDVEMTISLEWQAGHKHKSLVFWFRKLPSYKIKNNKMLAFCTRIISNRESHAACERVCRAGERTLATKPRRVAADSWPYRGGWPPRWFVLKRVPLPAYVHHLHTPHHRRFFSLHTHRRLLWTHYATFYNVLLHVRVHTRGLPFARQIAYPVLTITWF